MIDCVTLETSHLFADAMASQHRLRHRVFVEQQRWDVPTFHGMEYDQYDTPAAVYLVWRDFEGEARAVARLSPTNRPYMVRDLWPDLVQSRALPDSPHIWEGTRLCVDQKLPKDIRRRAVSELLAGCLEYGLAHDIHEYIIVAPMIVLRTYKLCGCSIEALGTPRAIDGAELTAATCDVDENILQVVRQRANIDDRVLQYGHPGAMQRAA